MTERRVLITGARGQLGRDVIIEAARQGRDAIAADRKLLDATDRQACLDLVTELRPSSIIHCAAWTDVDGAEANPDAAHAVNDAGVDNIVGAAAAVDAHVINVSTDYVFNGHDPAGYDEQATTDPLNVYGQSKLSGERHVLEYGQGLVVRTSWVFGEHGSNFVHTMLGLMQDRDEVSVVTDQVGCPTWTRHLATALLAATDAQVTGTMHLVDSPAVSWHDFAVTIRDEAGLDCTVHPVTSEAFPRPARRPACSVLTSTRTDAPDMGSWADGVRAIVRERSLAERVSHTR